MTVIVSLKLRDSSKYGVIIFDFYMGRGGGGGGVTSRTLGPDPSLLVLVCPNCPISDLNIIVFEIKHLFYAHVGCKGT